jgi:hypothetical protein
MNVHDENFEKLFSSLPCCGWLKKDEAALLFNSAKNTSGAILEVGCYYGRSTVLLASLSRQVVSVDPFSGFDSGDPTGDVTEMSWRKTIADHGCDNVILYRQKIENWVVTPCGFAYLDGDHTFGGTMNQLIAAKQSGVSSFCIHDYCHQGDGAEIVRAIDESGVSIIEVVGEMAHCVFA